MVVLLVTASLLELSLRVLRPHHDGLRRLLYESSLPADFSRIHDLPALMQTTLIGYSPFEERSGFVLNSRSMPTQEYTPDKPAETFRVLAIGDSFTYGVVPVADHWTTLLEQGLAQSRRERVEVLRLAVPGTGPPFQLRLFQIEGARLKPDLVILAFFVGNDFFDELGGEFTTTHAWGRASQRLSEISMTFRLIRNMARAQRGVEHIGKPVTQTTSTKASGGFEAPGFADAFDENRPTFTREAFRDAEASRMSLCLKGEALRFRFRLDRVVETLEAFQAEVRRAGAKLVVLIIPDEYQVNPHVFRDVAAHANRTEHDYEIDRPQRELTAALAARAIPFVDLLPEFRASAKGQPLYIPRDTHWNRAGNRLAARELGRALSIP